MAYVLPLLMLLLATQKLFAQMFVPDQTSVRTLHTDFYSKTTGLHNHNFFTSVSAYDATVFSSFRTNPSKKSAVQIGISQFFAMTPMHGAALWQATPFAPIQGSPGYPNFIPMQTSASVLFGNPARTFYGISAGNIAPGFVNPQFRSFTIGRRLGGRN